MHAVTDAGFECDLAEVVWGEGGKPGGLVQKWVDAPADAGRGRDLQHIRQKTLIKAAHAFAGDRLAEDVQHARIAGGRAADALRLRADSTPWLELVHVTQRARGLSTTCPASGTCDERALAASEVKRASFISLAPGNRLQNKKDDAGCMLSARRQPRQ